jgi:hypothetical protein
VSSPSFHKEKQEKEHDAGSRSLFRESEESEEEVKEDCSPIASDGSHKFIPIMCGTSKDVFEVPIRHHPLHHDIKSTSSVSPMRHRLNKDSMSVVGLSRRRGYYLSEDSQSTVSLASQHKLGKDQATPRTYIDKVQVLRNAMARDGGSSSTAGRGRFHRQETEASVVKNATGWTCYTHPHPHPQAASPEIEAWPILQRIPSEALPPDFPHRAVWRSRTKSEWRENGAEHEQMALDEVCLPFNSRV